MATTEAVPANNPTLSAEEIGKRFLRLIEGLKSRNDLSVERVREDLGISLRNVPVPEEGIEFYSYSQPLAVGWHFIVNYFPESPGHLRGVGLTFNNQGNRYADMTTLCALDFEDYHNALKAMGFRDTPIHGEIGQELSWRYYKDDITLSIVSWPEITKLDGKNYRACVKSIGTLN